MSDLLATVTLEATNNIARDHSVNTFAFHSDLVDLTDEGPRTVLTNALESFYNDLQGGLDNMCKYLSPTRKRTASGAVIRGYDITGKLQRVRGLNSKGVMSWQQPNIGSPAWVNPFTLGAIGNNPEAIPAEVAIVLSLRSETRASELTEAPNDDEDAVPDRPKARHTGRLFIGPLCRMALGASVENEIRVAANLRTVLAEGASVLQADAAVGEAEWCIWSRADGVLRPVHEVVVDDAFDTQRRRGLRATTSTSLVIG